MSITWQVYELSGSFPDLTDRSLRSRYVFITNRVPLADRPSGFATRYRDIVSAMIERGSTALLLLVSHGTEVPAEELVRDLAADHPGLSHVAIGTVVEGGAKGAIRAVTDAIGIGRRLPPSGIDPGAVVVASHLALAPYGLGQGRGGAFLLEEDFGHHDDPPSTPGSRVSAALRKRSADRVFSRIRGSGRPVVVLTDDERRRLSDRIPASHMEVVPLWVDTEALAPSGASPGEASRDVLGATPTIGWVGRLGDERWVEAGAEVLERALETRPWRWKLVGASPHPRLQDLAARHPGRVDITGRVPSVVPHYVDLDVALVPARAITGTKTTLLQAWAAQVPVVAAEPAARSADAIDGADVLVYRDAEEAIASVDRLTADPALRSALAAAGAKRLEHLDGRELAGRILDLAEADAARLSS